MRKSTRAGRPGLRLASAEFTRDQGGGTAIEYSLVAVGIAVAILLTIVHIGDRVVGMFATVIAAVG